MNPSEIEYWDLVAHSTICSRKENIYKRCELARRILETPPVNQKVLEIGIGKGHTAAAVGAACCGTMTFTGTDMAPAFIAFAKEMWNFDCVQTDLLHLPDGPFDQVWALDTLEHVHPDDRPGGFKEIARVLAHDGIILLNLPLNESHHQDQFEHGITDSDVAELARVCKRRVVSWERYKIHAIKRSYAFVRLAP